MQSANLSGVEKAAILLVLLGEEASAGILRHFEAPEITEIGRAMSSLGGIDRDTAQRVLEEYRERIVSHRDVASGGPAVARRILSHATPADPARDGGADGSGEPAGTDAPPFSSLAAVRDRDLGQALELEHPQTAALVLLHLQPERAAAALDAMSEEAQASIAGRLSRLSRIPADVTREVSEALSARFEAIRAEGIEEHDGAGATAEILKRMERSRSRSILARIEAVDPEIAQSLRSRVYTFEMLLALEDRGVQELLKGVDAKQLAIALKGTTPEVADRFLKNMSTRAADILKDEMELLGIARVKDVEAAQKEILDRALRLEEEGTISFSAAGGEDGGR